VAPSTQKQALNAIVFLARKGFGIEEFTTEKPTAFPPRNRRPVRRFGKTMETDRRPRKSSPCGIVLAKVAWKPEGHLP
jgi:hypothetical protein